MYINEDAHSTGKYKFHFIYIYIVNITSYIIFLVSSAFRLMIVFNILIHVNTQIFNVTTRLSKLRDGQKIFIHIIKMRQFFFSFLLPPHFFLLLSIISLYTRTSKTVNVQLRRISSSSSFNLGQRVGISIIPTAFARVGLKNMRVQRSRDIRDAMVLRAQQ